MKSFLGVAILLAATSVFASDLSIKMTGSTSYLINASAQSCTNIVDVYQNPSAQRVLDIAAYYMNYQGATLEWNNKTDTAIISRMDLDFPALGYRCTIASEELQALFFDFTNKASWDGTLGPASYSNLATVRETGSLCRIRCGSVTVSNPKDSFTTSGEITVYGMQRSSGGQETPISAKAPLNLIYQ
ncbi:MAG: hypothetical protein JSU04_05000 [Bdellovibrionales bacterium]|nr:hypothetical protein [Bdellovibrionales bacterium]